MSVELQLDNSHIPIFETFKKNDEIDIVLEHHHRLGILKHHSINSVNILELKKYATFILAEVLLDTPQDFLKNHFYYIFNHILEKSCIQPKRPRVDVAIALKFLLNYDGEGLVYNPFAGCSIAGAILCPKEYYGDGDFNSKIYNIGLLLNNGMGISNENFIRRNSREWLQNKRIDYLITTYTGYVDNISAFEFSLNKCLADKNFEGKYAGMVFPREIFEKEIPAFKKAIELDWIETILLLKFGEVAVLVNTHKEEKCKGYIKIINGTNPLATSASIEDLISEDIYAKIINNSDALKKNFLKSQFVSKLENRNGFKIVKLRNLVKKISKKNYNLNNFKKEERILAYIDRTDSYIGFSWDENIKRKSVSNLFSPVYRLEKDCIIVNTCGKAEPRLFNSDFGPVFFEDGYAFALDGSYNPEWLTNELQETYVRQQLHPYGNNEMVPEPLTEDDYLNLNLYIPETNDDIDKDSTIAVNYNHTSSTKKDNKDYALNAGYILHNDNKQYTILNFIGYGSFAYTYRAEMKNCSTGDTEIVAIKELFPNNLQCKRDNNRIVIDEANMEEFKKYKEMFKSEYDLLRSMGNSQNNHVTEVKSYFEHIPTGTAYYVMKYYAGATLHDMIIANNTPASEKLIINKIVYPLCLALNTMHSHKILHLDIKPENVVIDENGEAVVIDFGVAQQYNDNGILLSRRETHSISRFSAPENTNGQMSYFHPQADIFGSAATLFSLLSNYNPYPIENKTDCERCFNQLVCSQEMKAAISEGLKFHATDRPRTAEEFWNKFPHDDNLRLQLEPEIKVKITKIVTMKRKDGSEKTSWGIELTINDKAYPIHFGLKEEKMIYICTLLRTAIGLKMYLHEFHNNSKGKNSELKSSVTKKWLKDVYGVLFHGNSTDFDTWLKNIEDKNGRPLNQGKSNSNQTIKKTLNGEPDAIIDYCIINTLKDEKGDTFYNLGIKRENIEIHEEMKRLVNSFTIENIEST